MSKTPTLILAVLLSLISVFAYARRDDGLLIYIPFDDERHPETNMAQALFYSPKIIGIRSQGRIEAGRFKTAGLFSNSNGNRSEPNNYAVNLGKIDAIYQGSFSVAFWFKTQKQGNTEAMITGNKDWRRSNAPGWCITTMSQRNFIFTFGSSSFQQQFPSLTDGAWHHVAAVVNRELGTLQFYGDGRKLGPLHKIPTAGKIGAGDYTLIGSSGAGAYGIPGIQGKNAYVDDYGIWNRPLTEQEIADMGAQQKRIPEPAAFPLLIGLLGLLLTTTRRKRH